MGHVITNTPNLLVLQEDALGGFGSFMFVLGALLFLGAALGIYFNFWPISWLNQYRTDMYREASRTPMAKAVSFVAYNIGSVVFLGAALMFSTGRIVTFDRNTREYTEVSTFFGSQYPYPPVSFEQMDHFDFQNGKGGRHLLLVGKDGSTIFGCQNVYNELSLDELKDTISRLIR